MRHVHAAVAAVLVAPLVALAPLHTADAHKRSAAAGNPSVIWEWHQIGVDTMTADSLTVPPRKLPVEGYLYLAFMHAAVFNAVNGVRGRYESYRFDGEAPSRTSARAAAVAAAHRVLVHYSPQQQANLDAAYDASLARIPAGPRKARGIAWGELTAADLIARRARDGRNAPISFTTPPAPGVWQPTPPANAPFSHPWLGYVKPLLLKSGDQFDPGKPPALTSRRYARNLNEVKSVGSATSTTRTAAQSATGTFFSGSPIVQFTAALKDQALDRRLDLVDTARMYAAVHTILADAAIAIFWTKHHYELWRPYTAIRLADTDGNDATTADPAWNSVIPSPPYPDYVSGYNGVMGAFAGTLAGLFGSDDLDLQLISTAAPGVVRRYDDVDDVCQDVIDARVYLGIHFRFADVTAARMGQEIAEYGLGRFFGRARS
jgi:hypothetical protein